MVAITVHKKFYIFEAITFFNEKILPAINGLFWVPETSTGVFEVIKSTEIVKISKIIKVVKFIKYCVLSKFYKNFLLRFYQVSIRPGFIFILKPILKFAIFSPLKIRIIKGLNEIKTIYIIIRTDFVQIAVHRGFQQLSRFLYSIPTYISVYYGRFVDYIVCTDFEDLR